MTTILADVIAGIQKLDDPADIKRVFDAANARNKVLRDQATQLAAATLKVGDKVVTHSIRPKYLSGCTGEVIEVNGDKFRVALDNAPAQGYGRYYSRIGDEKPAITVSAGCLRAA